MYNSKHVVSEEARLFLENLMHDAGLELITLPLKDKIIADLAKRLDAKIMLAALSALDNRGLVSFRDFLAQNPNSKEVAAFFEEKIVNWQEIYLRALAEFKDAYLGR